MKKMSNETAAAIFCLVWEAFMYLGLIVELTSGKHWGWYIFIIDTAVQLTVLYYDTKISNLENQLKRTRRYLAEQSAEYVEYVRTHDEEDPQPTKIIALDRYIRKGKRGA